VWGGRFGDERVRFTGEGGECSGDFVELGADVGGGGWSSGAGVAGVGAGYAVAVVAFDPGDGGVAEPVSGDVLGGDPGEVGAEAVPEVVVSAGGDGCAVAVAEQLAGAVAACGVVVDERGHQCWADWLEANGVVLFV
jgi:hypothetical protein